MRARARPAAGTRAETDCRYGALARPRDNTAGSRDQSGDPVVDVPAKTLVVDGPATREGLRRIESPDLSARLGENRPSSSHTHIETTRTTRRHLLVRRLTESAYRCRHCGHPSTDR